MREREREGETGREREGETGVRGEEVLQCDLTVSGIVL